MSTGRIHAFAVDNPCAHLKLSIHLWPVLNLDTEPRKHPPYIVLEQVGISYMELVGVFGRGFYHKLYKPWQRQLALRITLVSCQIIIMRMYSFHEGKISKKAPKTAPSQYLFALTQTYL